MVMNEDHEKANKGINDTIRKLIDRADDVFSYLDYSYRTRHLVVNKLE